MSPQKSAHTQKGEHDQPEAENCQHCRTLASPSKRQALVNHCRVSKPGDKAPRLFRVPAPIKPPSAAGPKRSRDDPQGQQKESQWQPVAVDSIQGLQRGKKPVDSAYALGLDQPLLNEVHQAADSHESEYSIPGNCKDDVNGQPPTLHYRKERLLDLIRKSGGQQHQDRCKRHDNGPQNRAWNAMPHEQEKSDYEPRKQRDDIEGIGKGKKSGKNGAVEDRQ